MIKKILSTTLLCAIGFMALAQKPALISGTLNLDKFHVQQVKLYKVSQGACIEIAEAAPSDNGKFGFYFYPPYEGLYVIGFGRYGTAPNQNYEFYIKGGDKLSVALSDWDYKLTGQDNSKENKELYAWHQFVDTIYFKAINFDHANSTYVDFFPKLEAIAPKVKTWIKGKKTGNAKFDAAMPKIMKMDMVTYAANFLMTPRAAQPANEELSPYYDSLKATDFTQNTDLIYHYPWGFRTMNMLASLNFSKSGGKFDNNYDVIKAYSPYVINDTLKGDLLLDYVSHVKDYSKYKDMMDKYGQYILTDSQKVRQVNIEAPLMKLKKGDDAYNFSFEDNHGKTVTMSDLKGKVVLVDVWATWCGPCKAQLPYLKTLEEDMKDKNVKFISISVDEPRDKDKWLNFIDTAKLGGTQLFAGGWSQNGGIAKYYNITGIPRFMVFDKNGKIVSIDSPRPSEPALKALLEKTLSE